MLGRVSVDDYDYEHEHDEDVLSPRDGDVAQLGEHLLCKQGVVGSIPIISTFTFCLVCMDWMDVVDVMD